MSRAEWSELAATSGFDKTGQELLRFLLTEEKNGPGCEVGSGKVLVKVPQYRLITLLSSVEGYEGFGTSSTWSTFL